MIENEEEMIEKNKNHRTSEVVIENDNEEGDSESVRTVLMGDSYNKLVMGVIEIDKEGQLREVQRTRILLSNKVYTKDSKEQTIKKALALVCKLITR